MRIQFTLTSAEAKWVIAKGVKSSKRVQQTRERGKILLKGGTTISAVSQELCGRPLRISGMITPQGTLSSRFKDEINLPHGVVLQGDQSLAIDAEGWGEVTAEFTSEDLVITGANAFDAHGHAVMMAGSYAGGRPLPYFSSMLIEGVPFLIAAGLEKLAPGNLFDVIPFSGRDKVDVSYGMAVGLVPIFGEIFTEVNALETLAEVNVAVIGRGGILGAEGSTTFLIEGERDEVQKIDRVYQGVKGLALSGEPRNFIPCDGASPSCKNHRACVYKRGDRARAED